MTVENSLWNKYALFHREDGHIIFDPISLESVILSNAEYISLRNADSLDSNKKILDVLKEINITPKKEAIPKISLLRTNLAFHKISPVPKRVSGIRVLLTNKCNMQCDYCFVDRHRGRDLKEDELKKGLYYFFKNNENQNEVFIQWFGGEPTLMFDLIQKGDKYIDDLQKTFSIKKVYKTIVSNGLSISDEMVGYLYKEQYGIGISLDGSPEIHDKSRVCNKNNSTYKIVEDSIKRIKDKGIHIGINITPTLYNYQALDSAVKYFIDTLGIPFIYINFPILKDGKWNISGKTLAEKMYQARKIALTKGGFFHSGLERVYRALDTRIPQVHDHLESDSGMFVSLIPNNKISLSEIHFTCKDIQCSIEEISDLKLIAKKISKRLYSTKKCIDCLAVNICGGPSKVDAIYSKSKDPDEEFCNFCNRALELALWDVI